MNSTHKVNVIRIDEVLPCPNSDTLGIVYVGGYQCVVKKENYKVGELVLYVQPDTLVPVHPAFKFLWADREFADGTVPEKLRRVTVRRFRGNWSEGLLMPVSDFPELKEVQIILGSDVADLLGFKHYEEPDPTYVLGTQGRTLTLWQRILKFFGYAPKPYGPKNGPGVYDVESLKNYPRAFSEGEEVFVTEKIHGSNARYMFDGKKFWVGSHKKWWKSESNIWWEAAKKYPWIEEFCRQWPNFTLRGEVTPTQKGYPYGYETEKQFFVFDLQRPDGTYVGKKNLYELKDIQKLVPVVYQGPYSSAKMKELAEGNSLVEGAKNIREGIVVSAPEEVEAIRGLGRKQLKLKSLKFLEKETK